LAAGLGRQAAVLREAALLAGDAGAALAGDLALAFGVHRGEASLGNTGAAGGLTFGHSAVPFKDGGACRKEPDAAAVVPNKNDFLVLWTVSRGDGNRQAVRRPVRAGAVPQAFR